MRVLHITSDWKWTGSAAPLLALLCEQRARGLVAELACAPAPEGAGPGLAARARRAGVEPVLTIAPARGVRWLRDRDDARRLRALVREGAFDVLHAWHTRDHLLALRAAGGARRAGRVRVVRTYPRAARIPKHLWNRWLFGSGTDALLCVSPDTARANVRAARGGAVIGAFGAVDLERFRPGPPAPGTRSALGLREQDVVVGIAARVQRHRRFELLLAAFARLAREVPSARLLVVGRGTRLDSLALQPATELGIADRVVFAGHRDGDYPDVLRAIDVFTLLVPGSDGGCRALLEAAACGLPAVTTRRGAMPEIVVHGETGLVVDERPEALAAAWRELLGDPDRRARLGRAARRRAEACFSPGHYAAAVEPLYYSAARPSDAASVWRSTRSR